MDQQPQLYNFDPAMDPDTTYDPRYDSETNEYSGIKMDHDLGNRLDNDTITSINVGPKSGMNTWGDYGRHPVSNKSS